MQHPILTSILVAAAVLLCLLCSLGVLVMRDPLQRLHFPAPVNTLAILFILIAIWIEDPHWQSRIKAVLIALFLFSLNAILSHATARAIHIRRTGHWPPTPEENLPIIPPIQPKKDGSA